MDVGHGHGSMAVPKAFIWLVTGKEEAEMWLYFMLIDFSVDYVGAQTSSSKSLERVGMPINVSEGMGAASCPFPC